MNENLYAKDNQRYHYNKQDTIPNKSQKSSWLVNDLKFS